MKFCNEKLTAGGNNDTSIKLDRAILRKDYGPNGYTLDLTYTLDSPTMTQELHIPRLVIPLETNIIKINRYDDLSKIINQEYCADLGFGEMKLLPDKDGAAFTVKTVKEKYTEMTLDEIEKKLGYKVKIVSK